MFTLYLESNSVIVHVPATQSTCHTHIHTLGNVWQLWHTLCVIHTAGYNDNRMMWHFGLFGNARCLPYISIQTVSSFMYQLPNRRDIHTFIHWETSASYGIHFVPYILLGKTITEWCDILATLVTLGVYLISRVRQCHCSCTIYPIDVPYTHSYMGKRLPAMAHSLFSYILLCKTII